MRAEVVMLGSLFLTSLVVGNAFVQKSQFYPSVVYITKSNPSMMVVYVQALVVVVIIGKIVRKIFFGQLRTAEVEHLIERSWYAVTETCLAFTVFKDDFSFRFVAVFTILLFLKAFHWLAEDRVDYMERSPVISWIFHLRVSSLLVVLSVLDSYFIYSAYLATLAQGASVQLVFGFEYAILLTIAASTAVKYLLHTIDLRSETPWENKAVYVLYSDLVIGFFKVCLYAVFMAIMIKVYTIPLFAIRPMYLTLRAFKKSLSDVIMSRRAIRNMNELYPDATEEELASGDNVCIICREEMVTGAKKLPCNHIFHTVCLRSWFQRQQTCPTCRLDVLRPPATGTAYGVRPNRRQAEQQPPAAPRAAPAAQQAQPNPFAWPPNFPAGPMPMPPPTNASSSVPLGTTVGGESPPQFVPPLPPFFPFLPMMAGLPPPPAVPAPVVGLSVDELLALEGREREAVEARINCLRNIQTLLDAAVLQFHQYNSVVTALNLNVYPPSQSTSASPSENTGAGAGAGGDAATPPDAAPVLVQDSTANHGDVSLEKDIPPGISETPVRSVCLEDPGEGTSNSRVDVSLEDRSVEDATEVDVKAGLDPEEQGLDEQERVRRRRLLRFERGTQ